MPIVAKKAEDVMALDMTKIERQVLRDLRSRGYLVVVWTPDEIGTANLRVVEDSVVTHGNQVILDSQEEAV